MDAAYALAKEEGGTLGIAFAESGVGSLTVGCADCDVGMYQALGFSIPLGNMLAYDY